MQPATDRLGADLHLVHFPQQQHPCGARPTTSQESEIAWRFLGDPPDDQGRPPIEEDQRSSPPGFQDAVQPFPLEPMLAAMNGMGTGVQHPRDQAPGIALS